MLSSAFTAFLVAALVAQAMGRSTRRRSSAQRSRSSLGVVAAVAIGHARVAPPRLAIDLDPGRPDHQRDDHQHPRLRPDRLPQPADHLAEPASRRRHLPTHRAARLPRRPARSSAGSSRGSSPTARSRSRSSSWSCSSRSGSSASRWGLRTRAVGEHPKAAETVGIDVIKLRYRNVILGGIFAGLAGAYLTLEQSGSFQNGMTERAGLHRAGRRHLRALDADRGIRRCAPVHRIGGAPGGDQPDPTTRSARRRPAGHPSGVLSGPCRTS